MQVSKIKIMNFMGIDSLEFNAGKFVAFSGRNGSGKTSGLEAIKTALGGGHDASVIRNGAEEAVVELGIDDGSVIRARVKQSGTDREFRDANGAKQGAPASKIKSLIDALSVNPIEFLVAKPERRVQVLLESMPIKADASRLEQITGQRVASVDGHALDVIQAVRTQIYNERTATNGAAKAKRNTIIQLSNAVRNSAAESIGSEEELRAALESADQACKAEQNRIREKIRAINSAKQAEVDELIEQRSLIDAKIAEIRNIMFQQTAKADSAMQAAENRFALESADIKAKLSAIEKNREDEIRIKQTRETIEAMEAEADELDSVSAKQTAMIAALDDYKIELLQSLPVPGLEVSCGNIMYNGVSFDRVNTAQKVKIAVEIAKLRAGKLGLICVDGIELLDPETFDVFRKEAVASGVQMVVTRVASHEFAVEVSDDCD